MKTSRGSQTKERQRTLWWNKNVTRNTKLKLYNKLLLVIPQLSYGSETYVITNSHEKVHWLQT